MILLFRKKHVLAFTSITKTNRQCKISTHTCNLIGLQLAEPVNQTLRICFHLLTTRLFCQQQIETLNTLISVNQYLTKCAHNLNDRKLKN